MPLSTDQLFDRLRALGCCFETHRHAPLFTVEQSKALRGQLPGGHTKNLFLRDKKERMWLITAEEDCNVDLRAVGTALGAHGRLSFASAERLMTYLGVEPGAVTPFGLINDSARRVAFVLDRSLLEFDALNFHPLTNAATTSITRDDFLRFMEAIGHAPVILDLPSSLRSGLEITGPAA